MAHAALKSPTSSLKGFLLMPMPKIAEEVWEEFLERITNGTITSIVNDKSMPSWTSVSGSWLPSRSSSGNIA